MFPIKRVEATGLFTLTNQVRREGARIRSLKDGHSINGGYP
jgi:hypothetical protein